MINFSLCRSCLFGFAPAFAVLALCVLTGCSTHPQPDMPTFPGVPQKVQSVPEPVKIKEPGFNELRVQFNRRMARIHDALTVLQGKETKLDRYIQAITSPNDKGRRSAFGELLSVLKQRIRLEKGMLKDLDTAEALYGKFSVASEDERERLLRMNAAMDDKLSTIGAELKTQVAELTKVLKAEKKLTLFEHFTEEKTQFLNAMQKNLQGQDLPNLNAYFQRWRELVRTQLIADQYHLLNFAYYANTMNWIDGRNEALALVAGQNRSAAFLKDMGRREINAVNMSTLLNAGFGKVVQDAYGLPRALAVPPFGRSFSVSLIPDRGLGGIYYYNDTPDGLRNPTAIKRDNGTVFYGESIRFIVETGRDCSFIMRHVDAEGKVQQICPNRFARTLNHLRANVANVLPSKDMKFEFAASPPAGIDVIRFIVTPKPVKFNPDVDTVDVPVARLLREVTAIRGADGKGRGDSHGLNLQERTEPADMAYFDAARFDHSAAGNAVYIETFIRVEPLRDKKQSTVNNRRN